MIAVAEPAVHERTRPSTETIAEVSGLHISFPGGVRALRGVSLSVRKGEILGLVGESGSGKSVLGLSLLGLLPETVEITGNARVAGFDMTAATAAEQRAVRRRHLGAVFQDPMTSLNPTMRIGPQVAEAIGPGADRDQVVELLGHVGVPEPERRLRQYPHELSGGLRQRVMLAMACAGSPSLVIADEPTTALDVTTQAQVLRLMARLREESNTAFLLITHDLAVASAVADRIAVLYGGRLTEFGPAEEVLHAPDHPYTRGLIDVRLTRTSPRSTPLISLEGEPPNPHSHPPGCAFVPRCGLAVGSCSEAQPPLEASPHHDGLVACYRAGEVTAAHLRNAELWPVSAQPDAAEAPALLVSDLRKSFQVRGARRARLEALRGVSLSVPARGAMALVGESGCGKSTLLRVAAGLIRADGGKVVWGGDVRPQMIFQDAGASLTPWMRVADLLEEPLALRRYAKHLRAERILLTLNRVGLFPDVLSKKPRQLSGGQRQRVAIARAIIEPPRLLLCDEPISALDVSLAAQVLNLLGRLRRELGMAVLFVTHDLAAARLIADEIAVMYRGSIVEQGPADDIIHRPQHPYTRALLDALPEVSARSAPTPGVPVVDTSITGVAARGCRYYVICPLVQPSCLIKEPRLHLGRDGRKVACPIVTAEVG